MNRQETDREKTEIVLSTTNIDGDEADRNGSDENRQETDIEKTDIVLSTTNIDGDEADDYGSDEK